MKKTYRRGSIAALLLVATACSSGIEEATHLAVVDELERVTSELAAAHESNAELEAAATAAEGEAQTTQAELATLEAEADALRDEVDEMETSLVASESAIEELREIGVMTKADGATLGAVRAAGNVRCGIHGSFPGFSVVDENGRARGFDVDFCRAIAAAAVGDAAAVIYVPVSSQERFTALQRGLVDVVVRNTTHTLTRTADLQLDFGPTIFHDGQQFMGAANVFGDQGVDGLDGSRLCIQVGSILEERAVAFASQRGSTLTVVAADNPFDAVQKLAGGRCDVVSADGSVLAATRARAVVENLVGPGELAIFPATPFSAEPLAPMVLQGDTRWRELVDWVVYTTIVAEEHGITSSNIDRVALNDQVLALLGETGESPTSLGVEPDAFYQVIKQVGNYGEIYDRNLAPMGLERDGSYNRLASEGGLLYAPRV